MADQTQISKPSAALSPKDTALGISALLGFLLAWGLFIGSLMFGIAGSPIFYGIVSAVMMIVYVVVSQRNKKILAAQGGDSALSRLKTMLLVEHLAGLDEYQLSQAGSVMIVPEGLLFTANKDRRILIPWDKVESVDAGSEEQLRSRVTLSRFLLVGVFALALKKERKQKFFLTVKTIDGLGLWAVSTIGRDNRAMEAKARAFATSCNSKARAMASVTNPAVAANAESDVFEQVEKLASLLDKGLITEAEYEEKKRLLLDRI